MSRGTYRITATRYHQPPLPKDVLPLGISGKDNSPWGYKFENNLGKTPLSKTNEQQAKDLVINIIRTEPERVNVSLELSLEDSDIQLPNIYDYYENQPGSSKHYEDLREIVTGERRPVSMPTSEGVLGAEED
jgi:hypothetical protein